MECHSVLIHDLDTTEILGVAVMIFRITFDKVRTACKTSVIRRVGDQREREFYVVGIQIGAVGEFDSVLELERDRFSVFADFRHFLCQIRLQFRILRISQQRFVDHIHYPTVIR